MLLVLDCLPELEQFGLSVSFIDFYLGAGLAYVSRQNFMIFFSSAAASVLRHIRKIASPG